jgi:hypothetical protein
LTDQVFWYKAEPHPEFRIGAPNFWQYSKDNFSNEKQDESNNYKKKNIERFAVTKLHNNLY